MPSKSCSPRLSTRAALASPGNCACNQPSRTRAIKVAVGIFSHSISTGMRVLDVLLGLFIMVAGIIALRNSAATGQALLIFTVIMIWIGWIIEGIIAMLEAGKGSSRLWAIVFGAMSVLAGVTVLAAPVWSAL